MVVFPYLFVNVYQRVMDMYTMFYLCYTNVSKSFDNPRSCWDVVWWCGCLHDETPSETWEMHVLREFNWNQPGILPMHIRLAIIPENQLFYPLVNQRNYGKSQFLMGKSTINGPFSIAILVYRRVPFLWCMFFSFHIYCSVQIYDRSIL